MNCIKLFIAYNQKLQDRESYYTKRFGTIPEFKAGIDEGTITVAEIGDLKRELAYHGEVLHTAARLEKLCNKVNTKILFKDTLKSRLAMKNGYELECIGEFELRGKEEREKIYTIKTGG